MQSALSRPVPDECEFTRLLEKGLMLCGRSPWRSTKGHKRQRGRKRKRRERDDQDEEKFIPVVTNQRHQEHLFIVGMRQVFRKLQHDDEESQLAAVAVCGRRVSAKVRKQVLEPLCAMKKVELLVLQEMSPAMLGRLLQIPSATMLGFFAVDATRLELIPALEQLLQN